MFQKKTLTSIYCNLFQLYIVYGSTVSLYVTEKYEDFCSSEKIHETFNIFWLSWTYQSNSQIFESSKARYYQFFCFNDQLPLQVKKVFIKNESVNPYNTRGGKLLVILRINMSYFGTKPLRYNGPLTWNNFFQSINNNNFINLGITKFKKFLKNLVLGNC